APQPDKVAHLSPAEFSVKAMASRLSHASQLTKALNKLNVTLFDSGPDMALYAEKGSPLLERLRQVQTVDNIAEIQTIKNKLLNGTHAIIAWYSSLLGYQTIGQGMGDERVITLEYQAMMRSEEHTSELQSRENLVCRLLLEK